MWPKPQEPADLVTLTEEILNGKLHLLCSASDKNPDMDTYLFLFVRNNQKPVIF